MILVKSDLECETNKYPSPCCGKLLGLPNLFSRRLTELRRKMESAPGEFIMWKEIKSFHRVCSEVGPQSSEDDEIPKASTQKIREAQDLLTTLNGKMQYRPKIKLHGMNAGINIQNGIVRAQTHHHFAEEGTALYKFAKVREAYFSRLAEGDNQIVVFGEFCGPKIQKNVALSQIPNDIFVIFAVNIVSEKQTVEESSSEVTSIDSGMLMVEPSDIGTFMSRRGPIPQGVYILPWHFDDQSDMPTIDFINLESNQTIIDKISEHVADIDRLDPWVKKTFGVDGHGEGLVYYPLIASPLTGWVANILPQATYLQNQYFGSFSFKVKGSSHSKSDGKDKVIRIKPQVVTGSMEFAEMMCSNGRMCQGLQAITSSDKPLSKSDAKLFMDWVVADVKKEGQCELDASNLKWDDVIPHLKKISTMWFKNSIGQSSSSQ